MTFAPANITNCIIDVYINAEKAIIGKIGGIIGNGKNSVIYIKNIMTYLEGAFYNTSTYGGIIGAGHNNTNSIDVYTQALVNLYQGAERYINAY